MFIPDLIENCSIGSKWKINIMIQMIVFHSYIMLNEITKVVKFMYCSLLSFIYHLTVLLINYGIYFYYLKTNYLPVTFWISGMFI